MSWIAKAFHNMPYQIAIDPVPGTSAAILLLKSYYPYLPQTLNPKPNSGQHLLLLPCYLDHATPTFPKLLTPNPMLASFSCYPAT
jgi:hypothetical protein